MKWKKMESPPIREGWYLCIVARATARLRDADDGLFWFYEIIFWLRREKKWAVGNSRTWKIAYWTSIPQVPSEVGSEKDRYSVSPRFTK